MVAFRSIATAVDLAPPGSGSLTVAKPAGVVEGDFLYFFVASYLTISIVTVFPTGWTRTTNTTGFGSLVSTKLWKIAGASEPADYSVTWVGSNGGKVLGFIAAYSNPGWTNQQNIHLNTKEAANSTNSFVAPGNDYAELGSELVTKLCMISVQHGTGTVTPPATVTQRAMIQTSGGAGAGISTLFGDEFTTHIDAAETRTFTHNVSTNLQMAQLAAFRESPETFQQESAKPGSRPKRIIVIGGL